MTALSVTLPGTLSRKATFSKDRRKSFQRDLRILRERKNPQLVWDDSEEAEIFITLNVNNFGEESYYSTEAGKEAVRRVVRELKQSGLLRTLTISIDGVPQAVSMSALYNDYWVTLYAASNNDYDNLGKLLNVETLQEGCRLKVNEVNFMTGTTWKASWHMQTNPCLTMRKPAKVQTLDPAPYQP